MKKRLLTSILLISTSLFADSMCSYYKSLETAQEEHYVGFGLNLDEARQNAFNKCTRSWNRNICNGYRFSHHCNTRGWGCAYMKSEGTAQEANYPGFGDTLEEAKSKALSRCLKDFSKSSCTGTGYRFTLRCSHN